jgi:isoquinoline 1-oxidoreductase beta subunit
MSWDREEEFGNYVRPMTHHQLSAKVSGGRIEALNWHQASGDSVIGFLPAPAARIVGFDPGATRGAWIYYLIPNREVTVWRCPMPLPTGQWRGLGYMPNSFAIETFIDELAHVAGRDPLQFRLDHLPNDEDGRRMAAVLNAAAERAGWGELLPAGHGRGLACCWYHGTVVAEVAEISLDAATGQIRLHRVVAAMDCGRAVNPDQVCAQVEGSIVMGAGSALIEELTVVDGRVETRNFTNYLLFTMMEAPEIETIILETPHRGPSGVGEPAIGPIAPAIGNALFALSGVRLRRLPMTQERVLRALNEREVPNEPPISIIDGTAVS